MSGDIRATLQTVIEECLSRGPGYAQEGVVLREVGERLRILGDNAAQQKLLTLWHDLFREGVLSWGYDIDNPNAPFFHKPVR